MNYQMQNLFLDTMKIRLNDARNRAKEKEFVF